MYVVVTYGNRPAVLDTVTRVYYVCASRAAAVAKAAALNAASKAAPLL